MALTSSPYRERPVVPRLTLVTPPAVEPVTLAEVKALARIDTTADDAVLLPMLIAAARERCEQHCRRRAFINQVWEAAYDHAPSGDRLLLPHQPVSAVASVTTYDAAGVGTAWSSGNYTLDVSEPAVPTVRLAGGAYAWPFAASPRSWGGFTVRYTAGYGAAASAVPQPIRLAVAMLTAYWYDNRDAAGAGTMDERAAGALPGEVRSLLAPYRVYRMVA